MFGRTRDASGDVGDWQILKNRLGDSSVTLQTEDFDIIPGDSIFATTARVDAHYFDTQGCNEFLVGVEVPVVGTAGFSESALLAKFIERI